MLKRRLGRSCRVVFRGRGLVFDGVRGFYEGSGIWV